VSAVTGTRPRPAVPSSRPPLPALPAPLAAWLPGAASSVAAARDAARGFVAAARLEDPERGVDLVVSELVTNAVAQVDGCGAQVRLGLELLLPGHVRVTVWDPISGQPRRPQRMADTWAETGRGLILVGAYASAWGTRPEELGKSVWADVPVLAPAWWRPAGTVPGQGTPGTLAG
jgi:anti-sigma regulatory factor (Ser/Thr protein kinase)